MDSVLLKVPFELAGKLFKYLGSEKLLSFASLRESFTFKEMIETGGLSKKSARHLLKVLLSTEHVRKDGRVYSKTERIGRQL